MFVWFSFDNMVWVTEIKLFGSI